MIQSQFLSLLHRFEPIQIPVIHRTVFQNLGFLLHIGSEEKLKPAVLPVFRCHTSRYHHILTSGGVIDNLINCLLQYSVAYAVSLQQFMHQSSGQIVFLFRICKSGFQILFREGNGIILFLYRFPCFFLLQSLLHLCQHRDTNSAHFRCRVYQLTISLCLQPLHQSQTNLMHLLPGIIGIVIQLHTKLMIQSQTDFLHLSPVLVFSCIALHIHSISQTSPDFLQGGSAVFQIQVLLYRQAFRLGETNLLQLVRIEPRLNLLVQMNPLLQSLSILPHDTL